MPRYSQPRQLKHKRFGATTKAERNPWCIKCHQPMDSHGLAYQCAPCRWGTRKSGTGSRKNTFASHSRAVSGQQTRWESHRQGYPHCVHCKKRMCRLSQKFKAQVLRFRCLNCNSTVTSYSGARGRVEERKRAALIMLNEGYLPAYVMRKLRVHYYTLKPLVALASPKLCQCGQPLHHVTKCARRPAWQTVVKDHRTTFDDLLIRVNRRMQSGLPEEVRGEMAQMILTDIAEFIDTALSSTDKYLRQYKKTYPLNVTSLDANPKWAESFEG